MVMSTMLLLFNSCTISEDSYALKKSIFIEDTENPGLPIYSEWGYNTFGAYVDRQVFVSNNDDVPVKIIVNGDTLNVILKGTMNYSPASIKFSFIGYPLKEYSDLKVLNDSTIDLKNNKTIVVLTRSNASETLKIIDGKFQFIKVQDLYIDKQYTKSIISGTFNFRTFFSNEPVAISNGRFDLGVGYENFYNYLN